MAFFFFWNLDFSSFKVKELHCTSQVNSLVMIHRAELWIKITSFVKKLEASVQQGKTGMSENPLMNPMNRNCKSSQAKWPTEQGGWGPPVRDWNMRDMFSSC